MISNNELKQLTEETLLPHIDIELINIAEVWQGDKHIKELSVWKKDNSITGDLILNIEIHESFNSNQVKNLIQLCSKIDYRSEYFMNQNK